MASLFGSAALVAACASSRTFVADNSYDQAPARAPVGAEAAEVFTRAPWKLERTASGELREQREAGLRLPDRVASFDLDEVFVYAPDGSDVEAVYVSFYVPSDAVPQPFWPRDQPRAEIRVFIYRAPADLDTEWEGFERWWRERQSGTAVAPLSLPAAYPDDSKRMAWTAPVGDGYPGPAFEQIVLFHSAGWSIRYEITCAASARDGVSPRVLDFLRWIGAGLRPRAPVRDAVRILQ